MKKAKIYIPSKTATQSGLNKSKKWVLEFIKENNNYDHLMNWESSADTQSQVKLFLSIKMMQSIMLRKIILITR